MGRARSTCRLMRAVNDVFRHIRLLRWVGGPVELTAHRGRIEAGEGGFGATGCNGFGGARRSVIPLRNVSAACTYPARARARGTSYSSDVNRIIFALI